MHGLRTLDCRGEGARYIIQLQRTEVYIFNWLSANLQLLCAHLDNRQPCSAKSLP